MLPEHPQDAAELQQRAWILSFAKRGGCGAEFGAFRGHFSQVIAETVQPAMLYLVDPWTKLGEKFNWGPDHTWTNGNTLTTLEAREDCRHRMQPYVDQGIVEIIEGTAVEFCRKLKDAGKQLDFVYIDSSHAYEETFAELAAIDTVLSADGVILGDDWYPDRGDSRHGVCRAVHEFIRHFDYEIVTAGHAVQYCLRRSQNTREGTGTPERSCKDQGLSNGGVAELALAVECAKTEIEKLRAEFADLQSIVAQEAAVRDAVTRERDAARAEINQAISNQAISEWERAGTWMPNDVTVSPFLRRAPLRMIYWRLVLRRARAAARRRDWAGAVKLYGTLLTILPNQLPGAWVQYGHAWKESGALAEAAIAYRRGLLLGPANPYEVRRHLSSVARPTYPAFVPPAL